MKKIVLQLCFLALIVGAVISCSKDYPSNAINIQEYEGKFNNNPNPNPNPSPATSSFEKYLISAGYDTNNNGVIDNNEVDTITTLDVSSKNLTDLDGIQKFTALEVLNASGNAITEVTFVNIVLNDLNLSNNQLTKLDIAACTNFMGGYAKFNAQNNPALACIRISSAQVGTIKNYPNNWLKDSTSNFDTSCN